MRDKYGVAQDKYCYPETDVLTNLLDIRNADKLAEAEIEFTAERYRLYQSPRATIQQFTFEHLKKLHHHLFQDVYEWAGEVRDVDISKGETRFCTCTRIEPEAKKLFKNISQLENAQSHELFIEQIADLFCEMSRSHRSHRNGTKNHSVFACYLSKAKFLAVKNHSSVWFLLAFVLLQSDFLLFRQRNSAFTVNAVYPA